MAIIAETQIKLTKIPLKAEILSKRLCTFFFLQAVGTALESPIGFRLNYQKFPEPEIKQTNKHSYPFYLPLKAEILSKRLFEHCEALHVLFSSSGGHCTG